MNILDITTGHIKEVLNMDTEMSQKRLNICYSCPLFSTKFGGLCNNNLWLNPNTGEVSVISKKGYIKGCGCRLRAKTRLAEATCPLNKW